VIPPKFINRMRTYLTASTVAGTSLTQSWAQISGVSITNAFNTGQTISTAAASHGFLAVPLNGDSLSLKPDGYNTLTTMYESYKVVQSKIIVRLRLTNITDAYMLTLSAQGFNGAQSGQLTPNTAAAQPYYRSMTLESGVSDQGSQRRELVIKVNPWDVVGLTKQQYLDQPVTSISSQPAAVINFYYQLNLFPLIAATNAGILGWEFELLQDVEWTDPLDIS